MWGCRGQRPTAKNERRIRGVQAAIAAPYTHNKQALLAFPTPSGVQAATAAFLLPPVIARRECAVAISWQALRLAAGTTPRFLLFRKAEENREYIKRLYRVCVEYKQAAVRTHRRLLVLFIEKRFLRGIRLSPKCEWRACKARSPTPRPRSS